MANLHGDEKKDIMKKVIVFGTFDIIHPGHLNFFKQAKKYGDNLVLVVARDKNVKKIKARLPVNKENVRLRQIKQIDLIDKAVLGDLRDPYKVIKKEKPNVICLGYDQRAFTKDLKKIFSDINIIRLKSYKSSKFKSSKIKNKIESLA